MKNLFAVILPVLKLAVITVALSFSGCSQEKAKTSLEMGSTRWIRVNDETTATAESEKNPIINPETFLATGRLIESQGNLVQAAQTYQKACQARPDYVAAWNRLGIIYDKLGKYDQAEEAFNQALRQAPNAAFLHNNLGFSYLLAGKYAQAEDNLRQALKLNSQFQRARVNLGIALAKQNQFDAALAEFKKALPEAQAYYNLAYVHRLAGDWQLAGDCYKQALEIDPNLADAKTNLAVCQQIQNPSSHEDLGTDQTISPSKDLETSQTLNPVEKPEADQTVIIVKDLKADQTVSPVENLEANQTAGPAEDIETSQAASSVEDSETSK